MVNYNNENNVEDDSTEKMLWYVSFDIPVEDGSFKVETAFSRKASRWNKVKISALIRLMTEHSTIITRKFTLSLTSNDTNISQ